MQDFIRDIERPTISSLFTLDDALPGGMALTAEVARELGGTIEAIQTSPDFRRVLLRRGAEAIVIDLVREYAAQAVMEKPIINGIRIDPPQEILANKLCTLLSRSEIRDLVEWKDADADLPILIEAKREYAALK